MTFSEFIKSTDWPHTLQLAGTRIAAAAVILTVLTYESREPFWQVFPNMFEWLLALTIFMGIAIPAYFLAKDESNWWAGWIMIPSWLVCVADPPLKFLHTKRPDLVPVDEFKWIFNPPLIHIEKNPGFEVGQPQHGSQPRQASYGQAPSAGSAHQNDFEQGQQLFNRGEQKDGLEMIAAFADANPNHVEANLFIARELANADVEGFANLISQYVQNVLRTSPSNEEARRIQERLNRNGQSEPVRQPAQSTVSLAKQTDESQQAGPAQVVRIGWDAFHSAYQRSSSDQKAWLDTEEAGLLARKLVEEASLDTESTKIRSGLIRVISNYYLKLIKQQDLSSHIALESNISHAQADAMATKIIQNIRLV